MTNWIRGMVALGAVGAPIAMASSCASTKGTGSETHFVCEDDQDCVRASKGSRCVDHRCVGPASDPNPSKDGGRGGASEGTGGAGGRRSRDASTGNEGGGAPDDGSTSTTGGRAPDEASAGNAGRVTTDASGGGRGKDAGCADTQNDSANCGECGHVCGGATTCVEGECHCVGLCAGANSVAVDSTHVYFNLGPLHAGAVLKQPLAGGTPTVLATYDTTAGITIDTNNVYYVDSGIAGEYLLRVPKQGGPSFKMLTEHTGVFALVNDGASAYWLDTVSVGSSSFSMVKMPLDVTTTNVVPPDGSTLDVLASNLHYPVAMAVDSTGVYVLNRPDDEIVDGSYTNIGQVLRVPREGGAPVVLVAAAPVGTSIALDATSIYWLGPHEIMKAPRAGGAYKVLASRLDYPAGLAVDATNVYWSNFMTSGENDGAIMTVPVAGGTPRALASGQHYPWGIAIDQDYVYWSDPMTGTAKRVHK